MCCRRAAASGDQPAVGGALSVLGHRRLGVPARSTAPPDGRAGRGRRHVSKHTFSTEYQVWKIKLFFLESDMFDKVNSLRVIGALSLFILSPQWAPPGSSPQPAGGAEESDSGCVCTAWTGSAQHEEPPLPGT